MPPVEPSAIPEAPVTQDPSSTAPVDPAAKPQDASVAERMSQFARREKMLRARQRDLDTRLKDIDAREQALKTQNSQYDPSKTWIDKDSLVSDPIGTLGTYGLNQEQLTQMLLNSPDLTQQQIRQLQTQIKSLTEAQTKQSEQLKQGQEESYNQAIKQIKNEVKMMVDGNDEFETIKAMGAQDSVVELIKQTFDTEGYLMTNEEAAKEVENYLIEEAFKFTELKKIKARLSPPPEVKADIKPQAQPQNNSQYKVTTKAPIPPSQVQTPTLSNEMKSASKPLSARERAILAFQGKLQG